MTTERHGLPHDAALRATNPGLTVHASIVAQGETQAAYVAAWRNCDRNIREWWRRSRESVAAGSVLFCEYDVLCNVDLRAMIRPLDPGVGIAGAKVMSRIRDRRSFWPFREIDRLPSAMHAKAIAIAPLAVLLISRAALDAILCETFDETFGGDIFCEMRLPTVIRNAGFDVAEMELPNVGVTPLSVTDKPGIYHPVKP